MPTTHSFTSAKADGADGTLVRASNWNAAHVILLKITAVGSNYTVLDADEMMEITAGVSGFNVTLPTAVGRAGKMFEFKRIDAGAGTVTIATTGGQTIDGAANYLMTNQWQFLKVYSDGANWKIRGQN